MERLIVSKGLNINVVWFSCVCFISLGFGSRGQCHIPSERARISAASDERHGLFSLLELQAIGVDSLFLSHVKNK